MAQTIDLLKNTSFEDKMDLLIEAILKGENYDYVQLQNKPSINGYTLEGNKTNAQLGIPTKTSDLNNDSGFVEDANYVHTDNNYTDTDKNSIASIVNKVDKVAGKGLSTNDLTNELKSDYDDAVLKSHGHSNKTILDNTTASYTTEDKAKLSQVESSLSDETTRAKKEEETISSNLSEHTSDVSNPHKVTKSQVGLGNVENKTSATIRSEITKDNVTTALGYTPYTPNEVDNKISALETNIDWKESVNTYDDIATTYPNPEDGWTVNVKDTDYTYRYNGTKWVTISANAIPKATNSVDGLLSKEDHTNYEDANSKKHTHSNKSVLDGITSALISTWNTVTNKLDKTGDASNVTNTIITASSRTNLSTGEKLSISLGKIMKWFADLKTVAFSGSYTDLSNTPNFLTGGSQTKTSTTDGGENVFTFTKADGTTEDFTVKNGLKGAKGDNGKDGTNGVRGNTWRVGTDLTHAGDSATTTKFTSADTIVGDMYLNTQYQFIYQCTTVTSTNSTWLYLCSIKGGTLEWNSYNVNVAKAEQIVTSNVDGGENVFRFTLFDGSTSDLTIKNGTGVSIKTTSVTYQASASGTTTPTGTWQTTIPTVAKGQYLWSRTVVNYSDGNSTTTYNVAYQGKDGTNGTSAGFGTPTATVDNNVGTPSVEIITSGSNTAKVFNFAFKNLKGTKGEDGKDGSDGKDGVTPTIKAASGTNIGVVGTPSVTATTSGTTTTFTFNNLKGEKGDKGTNATTTSVATASANGLMSKDMVTKLNGIADGANKYSLPTASSSTLGGVKTTSTVTSNSGYTACPIISGVPYYKDTNTTYSNFVKSGSGAKAGLVPAPSTTAGTTKYLREDGIWVVPTDTKYTLPTATSSVLGGVKVGSSLKITNGVLNIVWNE